MDTRDIKSTPYKTVSIVQSKRVMDALSRRGEYLGAREREMVIMRFGLANEPPYTLQAIATEFNLTRERVRQIVDSALTKMGVDPW